MTVLIANMGETVVREVERAVEWVGRRSLLPEKQDVVADEERKEDKGIKVPKPSAVTLPTPKIWKRNPQSKPPTTPPPPEPTQNKPLSIRLSKEIKRVANDASSKPLLKYSWHEWVKWLRMMDEAGVVLGVSESAFIEGNGTTPTSHDGRINGPDNIRGDRRRQTAVEVWKWTWLDDNGPLFSSETETQWVLDRLCRLFERVVERDCLEEGQDDRRRERGRRRERDEVEGEGEGESSG